MRRSITLFLVLLVVFSGLAALPAGAQDSNATTPANNTTTTSTPTTTEAPTTTTQESPDKDELREQARSGEFDITELKDAGVRPANTNLDSMRAIGEPPMGFVAMRYRDPNIMTELAGNPGEFTYISAGDTVRQNDMQAYGSAFGEVAKEYTLVVVYWQPETVGNTSVEYAANQTVERHTVDLRGDELYLVQNISLRAHFDQTWHVTMWLEDDGEKVDGAQWYFRHRSNPESASVNIDSAGGAWAFALRYAVIPGVISLIIGLLGARLTLKRTGRGPGYGVQSWLLVVGLVGLVLSLIAYYQIAVILKNLPYAMGISIGVIAYAAGLTFHEPAKTIAFMRRELADAVTIPGEERLGQITDGGGFGFGGDAGAEIFDELTEALYLDLPEVPAVRTEDGYRIPVTGLRAFIARFFASAATLDVQGIATRQKVRKGRIDDIITVDPNSNPALEHKAARLVRVLPIDTLGDNPSWVEELVSWLLTAAIVVVPPFVGVMALDNLLNLPILGAVVGILVTLTIAYSAEDGWIEFSAAPPHYQKAEDNLTMLQRAYKEAKEERSAKEEAWEERAKTAAEAREDMEGERQTVTDKMLESIGVNRSVDEAFEASEFQPADDKGDEDEDN